jgi:hypothetical protein
MAWLLIQSQVAQQDANGAPLALGFMDIYDSGTSNRHNTYPTSTLSGGANANPLQANAAGRFPPAYVENSASLKIVIRDSTLSQTIYSLDPVTSPDTVTGASAVTRSYSTKNTDYTLVAGDNGHAIGFDSSGADRTVTANSNNPPTGPSNGFWINISKITAAGLVTIQPAGGQLIDGAATLILDTQYEDVELVSQGAAGWHVVSQTAAEPRGELPGINAQTGAAYTLVIGDKGYKITMNNAGANALTIPSNALVPFPLNSRVEISQIGAGQTSLLAAGGVSIFSFGSPTANLGWLKIAGQNAGVIATKTGTNTWLVEGSLTA